MTLITDLAAEVHDFRGRRVAVPDWEHFKATEVPHRRGFLGYHAFTTLGRHPWRFADARVSTTVGGLVLPAMSQLELRAPYVDACNGGKRRARWSSRDEDAMHEVDGAAIPHYRRPGMPTGRVVGMDMDHSYWQFVQAFSTQVEYRPATGAWGAVGAEWRDLPTLLPLKTMRSAICTASWRNKTAVWTSEGEDHEVRSPYYQPQAFRLLSDYLMSWAQEVVALFQPWAIIVDCVVLDEDKVEGFLEFQADRWGVTSHLEREWSPGEEWPWPTSRRPGHNLRQVPDLVRQRLAWLATGHGPHDAPLIATRDEAGELELAEPEPEPEPEPAPWQVAQGITRWGLLHVRVVSPRKPSRHVSVRRPHCAGASPGKGEVVWTEGEERAPPPAELLAALRRSLAGPLRAGR